MKHKKIFHLGKKKATIFFKTIEIKRLWNKISEDVKKDLAYIWDNQKEIALIEKDVEEITREIKENLKKITTSTNIEEIQQYESIRNRLIVHLKHIESRKEWFEENRKDLATFLHLVQTFNEKTFNSEIDWAKWNEEITQNSPLLKEYLKIEETTKANNTWMKNSDGTSFKWTPEQFIQHQSKNFKKAFPEGNNIAYRGAHQHITDFKNRERNDYAAFFTDNFDHAITFSSGIKEYYNPNLTPSDQWSDGVYQLAIPKHFPRVIGDGERRSWRLLNWDDKIAKGTKAIDFVKNHNDDLKENANSVYELKGQYDNTKKYLSTDIYANYIKNPKNTEGIFEIKNVIDVMGEKHNKPTTVFGVDTNRIPIKSLMYNNGIFDMSNPNIYK